MYSVVVGASLDFINKMSIDNVYSKAMLYAPKLLGPYGIDAGFFQSRANTLNEKGEEVDKYKKGSATDTTYYATQYSVNSSAKIDNLGLYLNPTFSLGDIIDLFLNLEYRHRTVTRTPQYSVIDSGAGQSKDPSFAPHPNSKYSNPVALQEITNDLLVGPGFTVSYSDRNVDFDAAISFTSDLKGGKDMLFEFELVAKPSNFQLGGEIRDVKAFSDNSQKEYLIYLAKRFPLSQIWDLFTGKK